MLPWFKHGDIQPTIKGSDHCPVYIDLHDEITTHDGTKLTLRDAMKLSVDGGDDTTRDAPRLASKYWDEYSGKQKLLSNFFGKKAAAAVNTATVKESLVEPVEKGGDTQSALKETMTMSGAMFDSSQAALLIEDSSISPMPPIVLEVQEHLSSPSPKLAEPSPSASSIQDPSQRPQTYPDSNLQSQPQTPFELTPAPKRRKIQADSNYPASQSAKKAKKSQPISEKGLVVKTNGKTNSKTKKGQTSIASFFASTAPSSSQPTEPPSSSQADVIDIDELLSSDDILGASSVRNLSPKQVSPSQTSGTKNGKGKSTQSWSNLFARTEPPKCIVHGESAKEFTVNKPGPNKGKKFYLCSRYVTLN